MSALEFDAIHWEEVGGDLRPLETPLDTNYPAENLVKLGTVYGFLDQYEGTANDLTVPRPTTPSLRITNNDDGTGTATISGSDSGTTNTVYVFLRHGGVLELVNAGSRTGDGDVSLSNLFGEYIGFVVSSASNILSLPSDPDGFWITNGNQYLIRTATAEAWLQTARLSQYGVEVIFTNGINATPVTVWATVERGSETISLRRGSETDTGGIAFHIGRQTGFPPETFKTGATITYDETEYEIDIVEPSNGTLTLSSSFRVQTGRFRASGNF